MTSTLDAPRKLSKLEAVNTILQAYGISDVSSLGASDYASQAEQHLIRAIVDLNLRPGMHFNTSKEETWSPDINGELLVAPDVIKVVPTYMSIGDDIIEQNGKLYNRESSTYVFTNDLYVTVTRAVPFDNLPMAASWYITMAACVSFLVTNKPGDPALGDYRQMAARALVALEQDDADRGGANLIDQNAHFYRNRGRARARRRSI